VTECIECGAVLPFRTYVCPSCGVEQIDFGPLEAAFDSPLAPVLPVMPSSYDLLREAFVLTSSRWSEFYREEILDSDSEFVMRMMMSRVAETPGEGPPIEDNDPRLSAILSMGMGGYAWRAAEEAVGRTICDEIVNGIHEAIGFIDLEAPLLVGNRGQQVLYQASANAIAQKVPLWYTAPGYWGWGGIIFWAGLEYVCERVVLAELPIHRGDIYYAFCFGVALRHVEQQLAADDAPRPGEWASPEWEICEIELRPSERVFVAVAQNPGAAPVIAKSQRLPKNRLPLPSRIDRRPLWSAERHRCLVEEVKQQGWIPLQSKGPDWWSDRFRRLRPSQRVIEN
jgi:hypothetical protein